MLYHMFYKLLARCIKFITRKIWAKLVNQRSCTPLDNRYRGHWRFMISELKRFFQILILEKGFLAFQRSWRLFVFHLLIEFQAGYQTSWPTKHVAISLTMHIRLADKRVNSEILFEFFFNLNIPSVASLLLLRKILFYRLDPIFLNQSVCKKRNIILKREEESLEIQLEKSCRGNT